MANKFKCKDCRHSFSLNTGSEAICPKCKSDNIEPANGSNIVWKLLLFVVMAVVGYFTTDTIVAGSEDTIVEQKKPLVEKTVAVESPIDDEDFVEEEFIDDFSEPVPLPEAKPEPVLPIDTAVFVISNKTLKPEGFSFVVQCQKIPADYKVEKYMLFLGESDAEPTLVADATGLFSSDKYFANDGKYFVKALFVNNNTTTLKPIDGIVKPEVQVKETKPTKMEKEELQSKIDKSVSSAGASVNAWFKPVGGDRRVLPKSKITLRKANSCKSIENDLVFTDIQKMINYGKSQKVKINVVSVSYNGNNVIDAFEISTSMK